MERLTDKREADAQREDYECRLANGYPRNIPEERFLRLAAYEDSGLEPEEVLPKDKADEIALKLMRLADLENLCSYDRLRELAEADKDGRVVVRPCKGLSTKPDDGRQIGLEQAIAHLEGLLRDHDFECEDCKRDHRELLELLVELKERRG